MLRQGPENWTSKEYRGIWFRPISGISVFHQAQVAQLKKVRQKLPRRGTGNMGWAMLDHARPQDFNMAEKYWKTTAVCRRTAWCGLGDLDHVLDVPPCSDLSHLARDLGKWSCKTLYQRPPAFTLSVFISNCEHTQKVYSTFPCKACRQQIPGDIAQLWHQFVLHIEISETSIDLHLPSSLTLFRLIWKKFWHVPYVHQPWYPESLFATHTMEDEQED